MPAVEIRTLGPDDAAALAALRREALAAHPLAFAASPDDDRAVPADALREALAGRGDLAVFGAFVAAQLVGMVGVYRPDKAKMRHRGEVWGMYVAPAARGRGAGAALLAAAVERCRAWPGVVQVQLCVSDAAPEAKRLYERAGFRTWGYEPRALHWEGRFAGEHHLVLDLD